MFPYWRERNGLLIHCNEYGQPVYPQCDYDDDEEKGDDKKEKEELEKEEIEEEEIEKEIEEEERIERIDQSIQTSVLSTPFTHQSSQTDTFFYIPRYPSLSTPPSSFPSSPIQLTLCSSDITFVYLTSLFSSLSFSQYTHLRCFGSSNHHVDSATHIIDTCLQADGSADDGTANVNVSNMNSPTNNTNSKIEKWHEDWYKTLYSTMGGLLSPGEFCLCLPDSQAGSYGRWRVDNSSVSTLYISARIFLSRLLTYRQSLTDVVIFHVALQLPAWSEGQCRIFLQAIDDVLLHPPTSFDTIQSQFSKLV